MSLAADYTARIEEDHASSAATVGVRQSDPAVTLACYPSFSEARPLQIEWDRLVERVGGDLFTTFDWCETWWRHFGDGRKLMLFVARVRGQLVAVLPCFAETLRWGPIGLRVVRNLGCDHCVTTSNVAVESRWLDAVVPAWLDAIDAATRWHVIHLGEIPGYDGRCAALSEAIRRARPDAIVRFGNHVYPHMVFDVPNDYESFLAGLSVKERRNVRRDERQADRQGATVACAPPDPDAAQRTFSDLISLHRLYWNARGRLGHFAEWPGAEAFHRDVVRVLGARSRLVLLAVDVGGRPVVAEYGGVFAGRLHWIIGGRSPETTSRIGFCALLRAAIQRGVRSIDALPGFYDYKRRLGAQVLFVKSISVIAPGLPARTRVQVLRLVLRVVSLVYHRAWFWHLAPWLRARNVRFPFSRAGLWKRFIRADFLVAATNSADERSEDDPA